MSNCSRCGTNLDNNGFNASCPVCGSYTDIGNIATTAITPNDQGIPDNFDLGATLRDIFFNPMRFFARINPSSDVFTAWIFGLACGTLGLAASALVPDFGSILARWTALPAEKGLKDIGTTLLFAPFVTAVGIYLSAIYSQTMMKIAGLRRQPFKATLLAMCYAEAPALLFIIPIFGSPTAVIWSFITLINAVAAVHRQNRLKTALVLLMPAIAICIIAAIIIAAAIAGGIFAGQMFKDLIPFGR